MAQSVPIALTTDRTTQMDSPSDTAATPPHSTRQAQAAAEAQPVQPAQAHETAAANRHMRSISSVQPRAVLVSPDRLQEFAVPRAALPEEEATSDDEAAAALAESTARRAPSAAAAAVAAATKEDEPRPWSSGSAVPASLAEIGAVNPANKRPAAAKAADDPATSSSSSARRPAPPPPTSAASARSSVPRTQLIVPQLHAAPAPLGTMHALRASPSVHTAITGPANIAAAMRAQRFFGAARGLRKGAAASAAATSAVASHRAENEVKEQATAEEEQQQEPRQKRTGVTVLSLPHTNGEGASDSALPAVDESTSEAQPTTQRKRGGRSQASKPSDSIVAPIVLLSPSAAFALASAPLPAAAAAPAPTPLPIAARFVKSFSRAPPFDYGEAGVVVDADFQAVATRHAHAAEAAAANAALKFNALHVSEHSFAPSVAPSRSLKAAPTTAATIAAKAAQLRKTQLDASRAATRAGWSQGDLAEAAQGTRPKSREDAAQAVQHFLQSSSAPPIVVKIAGQTSAASAASAARIAAMGHSQPPAATTLSMQDAEAAMRAALSSTAAPVSPAVVVAAASSALSSLPPTLSGGSSLRYTLDPTASAATAAASLAAAPAAASASDSDALSDALQSRPASSPSPSTADAPSPELPAGRLSGSEAAHLNAHWHSRSGLLRGADGALHPTPTDAGAVAATPAKSAAVAGAAQTSASVPPSTASAATEPKSSVAPELKAVLAPEASLRPDAWSAPKRYHDAQSGPKLHPSVHGHRIMAASPVFHEQKEPFVRLHNTRTMTTANVAAEVLEVVNSYLPHTHPPIPPQQQSRRPHEIRGAPPPLVAPSLLSSASVSSVLDAGQTSHLSSAPYPNSNHDASSIRRGAKASTLIYTLEGPRAEYKKHEPEPPHAVVAASDLRTRGAATVASKQSEAKPAVAKPTQQQPTPSFSSQVQSASNFTAPTKPPAGADPSQSEPTTAAPAPVLSGVALERRIIEWRRELGLLPDPADASATPAAAPTSFTPSFAPVPVLPRMSDQALRDCRVMNVPSYPDPDPRFDPRLQDRSAVVGEVWALWTADEKADYLYREAGTSLEAVLAAHAEQVSAAREDARSFAGFDSLQDFLAMRDRLTRGDVPQLADRPGTGGGSNDGLALHASRPTAERISNAERLATAHQLMGVAERSLTSKEEHALRIQELHRQKMAARTRGTSRLGGAHADEAEAVPLSLSLIPTHDPTRLRRADVSLVRSSTRGLASDLIVQDVARQGIVAQASEVLARFNAGVHELERRQKQTQEQRERIVELQEQEIMAEAHAAYPSGSQTARPASASGLSERFPRQVAVAPFTPFLASSRLTASLASTRSPDPWSLDRRPARLAGGVPAGAKRVQGGDTVHVATQAAHAVTSRTHHASPGSYAADFFRAQQASVAESGSALGLDRDGAAHQAHLDRLMHAMQADLPAPRDSKEQTAPAQFDPNAPVPGGPRPMSPPPPQLQHFMPRRSGATSTAGAAGPSAPVQRWHQRMMAYHQREEREQARAAGTATMGGKKSSAAKLSASSSTSASAKSLRRDHSSKAQLGSGSAASSSSITSFLPSSLSQAVSGSASHSQYLSQLTQHRFSDLGAFDGAMLASIESRHVEAREERLGMDMQIKLLEEEELQHQIKLAEQDKERSRAIEERRQNILTT